MYNSALKNIVNIDISDVVIKKMNLNYKDKFPEMHCKSYLTKFKRWMLLK